MANVFQNQVAFTNETLRVLKNNIVLGKKANRDHQKKFNKGPGKIGDTFNIRRPYKPLIQTGASFNPTDYTETSIPLVVNSQKHADVTFTSADLTLKDEEYQDRIIRPTGIRLAQQVDIDGYVNAKNTVGAASGTFGTAPNNVSFLTALGQRMDDFSVPRDKRYLAIEQSSNASLINALSGFFNNQKQVGDQYSDGVFQDNRATLGFMMAMSQNVARHTVGPLGGAPTVNGANQGLTSGWANTSNVITAAWNAAAAVRLNAGDIVTFAGCNAVNPVTLQSTGNAMQFVVTQQASSDAAGALTMTVSPAIITAGPFQNVSAAPTNGGLVTVLGTAAQVGSRSIAWDEDAFALAVVPLENLATFGGWGSVQSQDGFSVRVFRQAAISSDSVGGRVDILYGWATPYPEQACQFLGA
jgi:hypothetical protein